MVVVVDDLIDALKLFSSSTESMGCVHSSIFRSIHGNMIIWYGAWMKRSSENKEFLHAAFLQMLTNVSSMAILADHSFFDAYAGESKDGFPAAKFSTGGIISIGTAALASNNLDELSHANLALFKAYFQKMEGAISGVCLRCEMSPRVACLFVWKSLHACYSWILNTDYRATVLPYLNRLTPDIKFDIFRVLYVSDDNVPSFQYLPPQQMLENGGGSKQDKVMQGSKNAAADV